MSRAPSHRVSGEFLTDLDRRLTSQDRRAELAEAGRCINGPRVGSVGKKGVKHGRVVRGGKCARCLEVHKRTA